MFYHAFADDAVSQIGKCRPELLIERAGKRAFLQYVTRPDVDRSRHAYFPFLGLYGSIG